MFFDRILAYTLVLLAIFQCDLVSARSQFRDSATPDAISNLQTNAARMAAGLNPLRPRNLFIPSRVVARGKAGGQASAVPYAGKIRIRKASDLKTSPGFLRDQYTNTGRLRIHQSNKPLTVLLSLSGSPSGSSVVNLAITNSGTPWPFVGIAGGTLSGSSSASYNYIVGTDLTPLNSVPTSVGNSASSSRPNSESMIWSYNTATGEISARWRNTPTSSILVNFFYVESGPNEGVYAAGTMSIDVANSQRARLYLEG